MSNKTKLDIVGQEVELDLPQGAVVTGAVVYVSYQRVSDEGNALSNELWGASPMTAAQAVGLARVGGIALEKAYTDKHG